MNAPLLHIYAQRFGGETAYIIGSREAIAALARTLNAVVTAPTDSGYSQATVEGYVLHENFTLNVILTDRSEDYLQLALPYTHPSAAERGEERRGGVRVLWPEDVLNPARLSELRKSDACLSQEGC